MFSSKVISNGIVRAFLILMTISLILYFLYEIKSLFIYLFIALVVTLIANPFVNFFNNKCKFPRTIAIIVTLVFILLILIGFIMMFVPLIITQAENLSLLNTATLEKNITNLLDQINNYFSGHNIDAQNLLMDSKISSKLNFDFVPVFLNALLNTLSDVGVGIGAVLFSTFFFLKDKEIFIRNFKMILPNEHEEKILITIEKTNHLLSRYFIGLIIQLTILFVLYLAVLLIFGVENAFIIAFLSAILNIIPYIGPLIASILVCVLTMLGNIGAESQADMIYTALYVLIGYCIVQLIDNNVSSPIIFSNSINSHPLEIFFVILISGYVTGILGMILAIPIYTTFKVVAKEFFPKNTIIKILTKNI